MPNSLMEPAQSATMATKVSGGSRFQPMARSRRIARERPTRCSSGVGAPAVAGERPRLDAGSSVVGSAIRFSRSDVAGNAIRFSSDEPQAQRENRRNLESGFTMPESPQHGKRKCNRLHKERIDGQNASDQRHPSATQP